MTELRYVIERRLVQGINAGKFWPDGIVDNRDSYRKRLATVMKRRGDVRAFVGHIDNHGRWVRRHQIGDWPDTRRSPQ